MVRNSQIHIISTQKITNANHSDDNRTSHNILMFCENRNMAERNFLYDYDILYTVITKYIHLPLHYTSALDQCEVKM